MKQFGIKAAGQAVAIGVLGLAIGGGGKRGMRKIRIARGDWQPGTA